MWVVAGVVLILDQITKIWAASSLVDRDIDLFWTARLNLTRNYGSAFGLGSSFGRWLGIAIIGIIIGVIVYSRSITDRRMLVLLGGITGGAIGNIIDRIFRAEDGFMSGGVIDFIDFCGHGGCRRRNRADDSQLPRTCMIDEVLPEALDGERLDRVVAMLDGCSRSVAATLIAKGAVRLDGLVTTQRSSRVASGMQISFEATIEEVVELAADAAVEFETVFVDEHIVVVNKPAGLIVHPGAGRPDNTLVNGLLHQYPDVASVGQEGRPGIVHRLDGDTSGLLVVARTGQAYDHLTGALANHDVERVYAAVVSGTVTDDRGVIDAPIGRSTQRRTRMAVIADGRDARTHYEVRDRNYEESPVSYLRCQLETGRTHQIRVHLSAIGHPVLGDPTYGNRTSKEAFGRVALHAQQLAFVHPASGEQVAFEAPLPEDLAGLVSSRFDV